MAWEVSTPRLGRTVARALKFDARDAVTGLPGTLQIGSYGGAAMPIFLTLQRDADGFRAVVSELVARQREHFILLAPTNRFHDAGPRELLAAAKVGFFDLASHVTLTAQGEFRAAKVAADLFPPFLPTAAEPTPEDVLRAALALVMRLNGEDDSKPPTLLTVFRLYCGEGLTIEQIRKRCRCSKGTVINRMKLIRKKTGLDLERLQAYSNHFEKVEEAMDESRASKVRAKGMLDAADDDSNEDN